MWKKWFWITEKKGNNAFSYERRGEHPTIFVTPRKEGILDDLKVGKEIVFQEADEQGNIKSYKGLQYLLKIKDKNIYIVDNHNHALYIWYHAYFQGQIQKWILLLHIDQHTDMNDNNIIIQNKNQDEIFKVTQKCTVGNFILPAVKEGLISEVIMLNTEDKVKEYDILRWPYILDIDIDFWHPKMGIDKWKINKKVRELIGKASLVTIATSPYFMDQEKAIQIVKKLFQ